MAGVWSQLEYGAATDDELVARTQRGDLEAFGVLWDRYHRRVYEYCYRCLGEREAAEDMASETFRKALAALSKYQQHRFLSWLFAIASNSIADAFRARPPTVPLEEANDVHADGPTPEELALMRGASDEIAELLALLAPDQRQVIAMRLTELKPTEIAEALGKSRPAVDMIYSRALERLRTLMGVDPMRAGGSRHD
jgi:RNA polymerase sigma-70 factor, ECF subfamily